MGFEDYKTCVPLPGGELLCFNSRTRQVEIVEVYAKPADLETIPKDAILKLKTQLDEVNKKARKQLCGA